MLNNLLAWLEFDTGLSMRTIAEEIFGCWEICREEDILPAISGFQKNMLANFFYKPELIDQFRALFALKYPYAPHQTVFSLTRKGGFVDDLRGPVESLIREGYEPECIVVGESRYYWEEDFTLEFGSSSLLLPEHFRRTESSESKLLPVVMGREEFRKIVREQKGKDSFRIRMRWLNLNSMPPLGVKMQLHLIHAGEDNGFHLNKFTGSISPLSRWLLKREQILQPADAWETFLKFRIADRVESFVIVPATQTDFRDFIVNKKSKLRFTVDEIANRKADPDEYFVAYTPRLQRTVHEKELRLIWRLIQLERQFAEGGRSRALSEKTLRQDKILRGIISDGSVSRYKTAAEIDLIRENEKKVENMEGYFDETLISPEMIARTAEQIRRHKKVSNKAKSD